jgi:hypothetical protein
VTEVTFRPPGSGHPPVVGSVRFVNSPPVNMGSLASSALASPFSGLASVFVVLVYYEL